MQPSLRGWWRGARSARPNFWTRPLRRSNSGTRDQCRRPDPGRCRPQVHRRGPAAGAVPGRAVPDQGPRDRGEGFPQPQRQPPAGEHDLPRRFQHLRPDQGDRSRHLRPHDQPRRRDRCCDRSCRLWRADAEPVEPGPYAGRIVRRGGGGGGGGDRGLCPRVGRWRIGPHPGLLLRAFRVQAHARAAARRALSPAKAGPAWRSTAS